MWTSGLIKATKDPKAALYMDEKVVIIKDKFPKAKRHFLMIAKDNVKEMKFLEKEHLPLLHQMDRVARKFTSDAAPGMNFRFGFHAEPSMDRLHLHIISDDMMGAGLKSKKHWNSFTTEFFVPLSKVIKDVGSTGSIVIPTHEELDIILKEDLKCHICRSIVRTIPQLKKHLIDHDIDRHLKSKEEFLLKQELR